MDDATHQRVMDPYELPDDILAELNRLNQLQQGLDQQKEQQHHLQQLNQQQLAWQAQQPQYGRQQQQQQQQQHPHQQQQQQQQQQLQHQLHQHHFEPEDEQQQLTESRMLGHNPEVWLFPESASSEPDASSDIAPQLEDNRPIQNDHGNDCLPNHIIADLPEYFPSGGLEAPVDISMEIDPIEADCNLMSVEQRDSLKETRNLFHDIDVTNNPNPHLLHEASFVNMTVQQAGYRQYLQQQAQQQPHQVYAHPAPHPASQSPTTIQAYMQSRIPFQGAAATTGVMSGGSNIEDQNVPPTTGTQRNEVLLVASTAQQGTVPKQPRRRTTREETSTPKVTKKGQKSKQKRRPSNMTDECSSKSVPGQRSPCTCKM